MTRYESRFEVHENGKLLVSFPLRKLAVTFARASAVLHPGRAYTVHAIRIRRAIW